MLYYHLIGLRRGSDILWTPLYFDATQNLEFLQRLFTWHKVQISSIYLIVDIGSNILENWLL